MFLLHVLLLTEDKLFLHGSSTTINDESVILLECEIMHEYLQKYKPLRILESIALRQTCEVDFIVKKYMKCYGIDNVRGGSYTDFELTSDEKKFIQREHLMTIDKMQSKCDAMMTMFNESYNLCVIYFLIFLVFFEEEETFFWFLFFLLLLLFFLL